MHTRHLAPLLLLGAALPAQMAGGYVIDPANPSAFASFTAAVNALFVSGVGGPVEILVMPGTYDESVLLPPIAGSSPTNTVTFRALGGPGTVQLLSTTGDIFALLAVAFAPLESIVFDGLDFTGAPGHAISATRYVGSIEIRNCTFTAGHQSNAPGEYRHAVIVSENSGYDAGWSVHHNHITLSPHGSRTSYGIYLSNGGEWDIHHNTVDLNGADYGLYLINNNTWIDRIYDNLFIGSLYATTSTSHNSVAVIRADISNYENWIVHNTFALSIPNNGCCIAAGGFLSGGTPRQNYIFGNVFVVFGQGTAVIRGTSGSTPVPFQADGNVYFCPGATIGRVDASASGTAYPTLAGWQAATGQDLASLNVDPTLVAPFGTPPDLRPLPGSPITGVAVNTPAYVTDDFAGRLRDAAPDAGAYESTSFARYGRSCPGTGAVAPLMGSSGTVALGSTTFAFELSQTPPNALAVLFGGFSRTASAVGPLPLPIGGGCEVLAAPDTTNVFMTSPQGQLAIPFLIPNSIALAGVDLFFQWAVVDPGTGSPYGITLSEGGALQL
jgi:hypothetical protein